MTERFSGLRALAARIFQRGKTEHAGKIVTPSTKITVPVQASIEIPLRKSPDRHQRDLIRLYLLVSITNDPQSLVEDEIFKGADKREIHALLSGDHKLPPERVVDKLSALVEETYNGRKERLLRKFDHNLNGKEPQDGAKKRNSKRGGSPVEQRHEGSATEVIALTQRKIIVEKLDTSINIKNGVNDERLLLEIRRSKTEIPEQEMVSIIEELQTSPIIELMRRNMKRVIKHGRFKGYHEYRRGRTGRVLFRIDEDDILHIRMGPHDHIYGTRKLVKDPATKL